MYIQKFLLPQVTIAAAAAGVLGDEETDLFGLDYLALQATFLYGAGGASVKAWVQTTLDGGASWIDIANFAFTTSAATKVIVLQRKPVASFTPTDGALGDDAVIDGVLGSRLRVKYTSTGTYSGATSLAISAVPR